MNFYDVAAQASKPLNPQSVNEGYQYIQEHMGDEVIKNIATELGKKVQSSKNRAFVPVEGGIGVERCYLSENKITQFLASYVWPTVQIQANVTACFLSNYRVDEKDCTDDDKLLSFTQKIRDRQLPSLEALQQEQKIRRQAENLQFIIDHTKTRQECAINEYRKIRDLANAAREGNWNEFLQLSEVGQIPQEMGGNINILDKCRNEIANHRSDFFLKLDALLISLQGLASLTPQLIRDSAIFIYPREHVLKGKERHPNNMPLEGKELNTLRVFVNALFKFSKMDIADLKQKAKAEFQLAAEHYKRLTNKDSLEWPEDLIEAEPEANVVAEPQPVMPQVPVEAQEQVQAEVEAANPSAVPAAPEQPSVRQPDPVPAKKESPSLFGRVGNAIVGFLSSCKEKLMNFWRWLWGSNVSA